MKFDVRFIQKKPKALEWLYLLIFRNWTINSCTIRSIGYQIILYAGKAWIQWLSNVLDIEFTL